MYKVYLFIRYVHICGKFITLKKHSRQASAIAIVFKKRIFEFPTCSLQTDRLHRVDSFVALHLFTPQAKGRALRKKRCHAGGRMSTLNFS